MDLTDDCWSFKWIFIVFYFNNWNNANGQIVYSVSEEVNTGTTVGNLANDLNLNVQDLERRGFQVVTGPNQRYFDLHRPELKLSVLSLSRSLS
uniref:Cadherin N-terminal domain-containing protein n=1 Tax=Sinocyclocheilus grahami TaxID=75366 RepID=A0A672SAI7_SINGR